MWYKLATVLSAPVLMVATEPTRGGTTGVRNGFHSSNNWSGYFVSAPSQSSFTDITSTWVVPALQAPANGVCYSSDWVGFDGYYNQNVEQCGTSSYIFSSGGTEYYAWYEFAPDQAVAIPGLSISPGDTINAEITYEPTQSTSGNYAYHFILIDQTSQTSFNSTLYTSYNDARSSAEWIVESPTYNNVVSTLANYSSISFSDDTAALNSAADQPLAALQYGGLQMLQGGGVVSLPTALGADGQSFTVNYTGPATSLTWNAAGGTTPADGKTWDVDTNNNWNTGSATTVFTNNSAVTFNDANNGQYAVTLNSSVSPASVTISNSAGNYVISGSGTIGGTASLTKSGSATLALSTANTYTGGTFVTGGVLEIERTSASSSALPAGELLSISGSGKVQLTAGATAGSQTGSTPASNINLSSLSITGNGVLDIVNNHILINYSGGKDPIASIAGWIETGYAGGSWSGPGIISSSAQANSGSYGIGYADSADVGNPAGLPSGTIEIMYTLLGDANLDGKVNGTDFAILATNFNQAVGGWDQGDFNYDGKANGTDFADLASNFNQGASQADLAALRAFAALNGVSANVPEPSIFSLLAMAAGARFNTRRRRRNDTGTRLSGFRLRPALLWADGGPNGTPRPS